MEQLARLRAPFPLEAVGFKPQVMKKDKSAAMAATYIDARAVAERLDEVFPLAWTDEYEVMEHVENRLTIECRLSIILNGQKITRSDVGESTNSDDERSASRWKSATSDAFKRAAVKFGVGAYLYALPQVWADYDADKRRFAPAGLKKLEQGYAQAVKRLGLSEPGERSQEPEHPEAEEAARPPAPEAGAKGTTTTVAGREVKPIRTLSPERAEAMMRELHALGFMGELATELARSQVGRAVRSLTELEEDEAKAVWAAAKKQAKITWQSWREKDDPLKWAKDTVGIDGERLFHAWDHLQNSYAKLERELAAAGQEDDVRRYWFAKVGLKRLGLEFTPRRKDEQPIFGQEAA